jgi:hypothetical protein
MGVAHENLVVLICLGDKNFNIDLTLLSLRSIRQVSKYDGDILLFTDFDKDIPELSSLKVNRLVVSPDSIDDPRNFRIYMHKYYDFSQHERIVYMDFDILVMKKLDAVFKKIQKDRVFYCYAPKMPWDNWDAFGANDYIAKYRQAPVVKISPTGICSGVFGISSKYLLKLLKKWAKVLDKTASQNDQHAFNELLVKGGYPCQPFPNEWFEYPLQKPDARKLRSKEHFIFYHYNPVSNPMKLKHMTADLNEVV